MEGINRRAISVREGNVFLDGVQVMDAVKLTLVFTPETTSYRNIGERGTNRKWIGHDITGTITQWRSTGWTKEMVQNYIKNGITPVFVIQGISDDKDSDYFDENGTLTVTASGCVLTGDIPLIDLDTDGDIVKDDLAFGAKDVDIK